MKIAGLAHFRQVAEKSIRAAGTWFAELPASLNTQQNEIAGRILKEIRERLDFLNDVGLDYLTLSRNSGSLSGGESQRIRLASQIGSGLTGVLYVLDEPSIGLHQRDNARLLETLKTPPRPRQHGDRGRARRGGDPRRRPRGRHRPGGRHPRRQGHRRRHARRTSWTNPRSLTGQYLSGALAIEIPDMRRPVAEDAKAHRRPARPATI